MVTVRDFTQVFDSYAQFEESMIAAKMETTAEMGQDEDGLCRFSQIEHVLCFQFSLSHMPYSLSFTFQRTSTWSLGWPALSS